MRLKRVTLGTRWKNAFWLSITDRRRFALVVPSWVSWTPAGKPRASDLARRPAKRSPVASQRWRGSDSKAPNDLVPSRPYAAQASSAVAKPAFRLLTTHSKPLVSVSSQRRLLRALSFTILELLTSTDRLTLRNIEPASFSCSAPSV